MTERLSARETLTLVTDDTTFTELPYPARESKPDGPLAWQGYDASRARAADRTGESESVVCGTATVAGTQAVLIAFEFGFLGGSLGERTGDRLEAAYTYAREHRLPVVPLVATGGSRMQEGMVALTQLQRVARQSALTREAGLPQLAVLRDPTTGGGWATLGAGADVILALPGAQVGFAGSRVRPPDADPTAYTAEAQVAAGAADAVVRPEELKETLGRWLRLLTTPWAGQAPVPAALPTAGREDTAPTSGTDDPAPTTHHAGPDRPATDSPPASPGEDAAAGLGAADPTVTARDTVQDSRPARHPEAGLPGTGRESVSPAFGATDPPATAQEAAHHARSTQHSPADPQEAMQHASVGLPVTGWEAVRRARSPQRPRADRYLDTYFTHRLAISGDRCGGTDAGMLCGFGEHEGRTIAYAAQAGTATRPAGYRTAARLIRLADRLGIPVLTLVDTPGAANDAEAERRGAGAAIADLFGAVASARTPLTTLLIGEGGSGGALALAAPGNTWATPDSYFSVIAPEPAAAILKRAPEDTEATADQLRIRPQDLAELGVIRTGPA
jgi:acetyl-CoA carboxylase carboxyl transferase subunit beta